MAEAHGRRVPSLPRAVAAVLAAGAAFWGVFVFVVFGPLVLIPFTPFGLGYVLLVGYAVRAATCPALGVRRAIWAASIAVQGGWLCLGLADGVAEVVGKPVMPLWWALATLGSVAAVVAERPDEGTPNQALQRTPGA